MSICLEFCGQAYLATLLGHPMRLALPFVPCPLKSFFATGQVANEGLKPGRKANGDSFMCEVASARSSWPFGCLCLEGATAGWPAQPTSALPAVKSCSKSCTCAKSCTVSVFGDLHLPTRAENPMKNCNGASSKPSDLQCCEDGIQSFQGSWKQSALGFGLNVCTLYAHIHEIES